MNKPIPPEVVVSQSKQPVGALFLKVINTLALLKTPRSTIKLKATLFVKKSRIAGSTYRSAGHRRIPKGSRQKIDYSEDSSDISVTSSLEKREIALPALSKSRAVQQGSFIDGHGSSSLGNQNPEALGVGLDSKQNLSKIEPDSDQRLASLRKTDGLRSGNSSRTLSLVSTKPSSHTSSRLSSPSHTLQIPIENSRKKNTDTFGTLTGVAHQLSKSSELECENDRLAAFIEEEKNCTKSIIGSYDAYAHSPSKRNTGVRSTVLSPLRDDRISASAGGSPANRGIRDQGPYTKLPSGGIQGDRRRVYGDKGLSPSRQRSVLSSKNALSPKFTNSAAVSEKEVSSPDKDKERLWERERVRGGSEISSLLERRRFWCKAVLIVCMKLFISRQAAQESIRQREVVRRRDAALLIERVYLCVRARRYAAMQLRILVRHKGAVKMLRQAIVDWRKKRAANIVGHFLSVCIKCKAHPHGMSAQYCLRFLRSVRVVQSACRDFLRRMVQQMATLKKEWDAFEVLYISSTVKAMRSETLRVISGSNLSLSSKTGNSANNGNSTITASSGSSSTGYGIDSDRRARSKSSTHVPYRNSKNALNAGVKRTKSSSSAHAYDSDTSYGEICRSSSGLSLSHSHGMSFDIDESDYGENCSHSSGSSLILGPSPHPQPSLPPMAHSVKSKAETKTYVPPLLPPRVNASSPFASPSPSLPYSPSTPSSSSLCASEHGQTTSIASPSCQFSFSPCFHSSSSSAFTSSHFSPASASLIVNSGSKDDKRRAYFRNMGVALEYRRATIDMAIKRHGRTFDVSDYVLPLDIKVPYLKLLMLQARRALSYKYKESLRLQFEWTGEVTEYSTADALLLVQGDNQDSLLSVVRYKMDQGASRPSHQTHMHMSAADARAVDDAGYSKSKQPYRKKRHPFVFHRLNIPEGEIQKSVRAAHEKNNTFQNVERHCT